MNFFNDVIMIWEMRGSYPDIKHFEGIDITELTKDDNDPFYLTIPIGEVNSISGNKRLYDDRWIAELERQVIEKRPVGIMGHLKQEELATAFPPEAIHWVGVQRIGEMLWGKGYVPPGEARERIRRYKATGKKLATSIFAEAQGVWDEAKKAYHMLADTLNLKQIDIGPADRVGIPSLAAVPFITAEMQDNEDTSMDKLGIIRELTAADVDLLPKAVKDAVAATVPAPKEVGLVAELRTALGLDEKDDLTAVVAEMKKTQVEQAKKEINGRINELVKDEEQGVKVKELQPLVVELINARQPQSVADVDAAYKQVVEMEQVKSALAVFVSANGGPSLGKAVGTNGHFSPYPAIPNREESK